MSMQSYQELARGVCPADIKACFQDDDPAKSK